MGDGQQGTQLSAADVTSFLDRFDEEIQQLARATLATLRRMLPDAVESADTDQIGLGIGPGYRGLVFTISPQRSYVNVGIAGGASLADPDGLLEGTGKVHRHLKVRAADRLADERVQDVLRRAVTARRPP